MRANLRLQSQGRLDEQATARIQRDHLWSRPSCSTMSVFLGTPYAPGAGLVPV